MRIYRLYGSSPEVIETIGPFAMSHEVILKRRNMPIVTKENYTWYVLKDRQKIKAFVGAEEISYYIKLQSFVELEASTAELRFLIKEVVGDFLKTTYPKLTVSVLHEYVSLFEKEKFQIVNVKTNWTDLVYLRNEKV